MSGSVFYAKIHHMKDIIILMGGQGVGKGTFARMLRERHDYKYIETGNILRESAKTNKKIADIMQRGELLPFEMLTEIVANNMDTQRDCLLDGFPRTLAQAQWLVKTYANKFNIHVLYLNVPAEIMIQRIQKRIQDGGGRADDADINAVRKRLDLFFQETMPAIEWLRTAPGIRFSDVDVSGPVDENFKNILTALGQ